MGLHFNKRTPHSTPAYEPGVQHTVPPTVAKPSAASSGSVRIIGGTWKKSVLRFPGVEGLRPTPDRVRETLFNWLGQDLSGLACLDLFAGSGALGFEAASRGATRVVLVERDGAAVGALRVNAARLSATSLEIVSRDAFQYLASANERFDVVFLDPPFRQNVLPDVLGRLSRVMKAGARVYVEGPAPCEVEGAWNELKSSRAGQVHFQLLERNDDRSGLSGDV
jgi:16S rRNA (guanine966-N2)-methyltransferase